MKKLIHYLFDLLSEGKVDLAKNHSEIIALFKQSNYINTTPQERMKLLQLVTATVRAELDKELEQAELDVKDITAFKKEPYVYVEKPMEKRNYDFLAMHNIEFLRDVKN